MKVLFLDVDGVLNHLSVGNTVSDELIKNLKSIIDKTQAKIILISTWRNSVSLVKTLFSAFEKNGLSTDCIYKIPCNKFFYDLAICKHPLESKEWFDLHKDKYIFLPDEFWRKDDIVKLFLKAERISQWIAIDDNDYCTSLGKNFFRTNLRDALSEDMAHRIINALNEFVISPKGDVLCDIPFDYVEKMIQIKRGIIVERPSSVKSVIDELRQSAHGDGKEPGSTSRQMLNNLQERVNAREGATGSTSSQMLNELQRRVQEREKLPGQ